MKQLIWVVVLTVVAPAQEKDQSAYFDSGPGFVMARGQWKATSGKQDEVGMKHVVEVNCTKQWQVCVQATASILSGDILELDLRYYNIVKWDDNEVKAESDEAVCVISALTMNFQAKSVIAIDSPKKGAKGIGDSCKKLGDRTRTFLLVDRRWPFK